MARTGSKELQERRLCDSHHILYCCLLPALTALTIVALAGYCEGGAVGRDAELARQAALSARQFAIEFAKAH